MRRMSEKRKAALSERALVRWTVICRDNNECQAAHRVPAVECGGPLDVHEIIPRSAWSDGWLRVTNCVLICRAHHQWVDDHPDLAREVGLHGSSWDRPDGHCGLGAP
jgi:hypothetical protein